MLRKNKTGHKQRLQDSNDGAGGGIFMGLGKLFLLGLVLVGFLGLHWSVIFAMQSISSFEKGSQVTVPMYSNGEILRSVSLRGEAEKHASDAKLHSIDTVHLPLDASASASAHAFDPPGAGHFKLAGDPALCKFRKWKWCYIKGNVETFRRVLGGSLVDMRETPALPMDNEGGGPWQLLWQLADETSRDKYATTRKLKWFQKINHFPDVRELGNKRYLTRNMAKAVAHFGADIYNVFPRSFQIPAEVGDWQRAHADAMRQYETEESKKSVHPHKPLYIIKASAKDRGEGIRVISGPNDLKPRERGVVQSYLQYPYLLNGYKFTMRIYAAYTSVDPVRLYLYPEGFVHMATEKYNPDPSKLHERYMHLTNPDINKERLFYKQNPRPFYWNFAELRAYIRQHGGDDNLVWRRIQTLAAKTLLCAETKISSSAQKIVPFRGNSFELIGMDVLVDDNLKPWLLEVNPDPDMSAHAGFQLAYVTKGKMMGDLIHLLGLGKDHRTESYQLSRSNVIQNIVDAAKAYANGRKAPPLSPLMKQVGFNDGSREEGKTDVHAKKHLPQYGCDLGKTAVSCGVGTSEIMAGIVAETSLEYLRERDWERVLPNGLNDEYLEWFYQLKPTDKMLQCWERETMACSERYTMDCKLCHSHK